MKINMRWCRPIGEGRYKFDFAKDEGYRHRHANIGMQRKCRQMGKKSHKVISMM
jgi:hypothetical protein